MHGLAEYGIAWMLGSIVIGALFSVSLTAVAAFAAAAELSAIPLILVVRGRAASANQRAAVPGEQSWPS